MIIQSSQELGIDLINYLITKTKVLNCEYNDENIYYSENMEFIQVKKSVYKNYVSAYQKQLNDFEKIFLFSQIDIIFTGTSKNPKISSNLHLELTLQNNQDNFELESLIGQKCKNDISQPRNNQIIIKVKS